MKAINKRFLENKHFHNSAFHTAFVESIVYYITPSKPISFEGVFKYFFMGVRLKGSRLFLFI